MDIERKQERKKEKETTTAHGIDGYPKTSFVDRNKINIIYIIHIIY